MNGLYSVIYQSFFCNTKQLLEVETKLIYIIHLRAVLFKLDNFLLWKCMYIFVESQVIALDIQAGFVTFVVYAEFRMMNVDISYSLLLILFMSVDALLTS